MNENEKNEENEENEENADSHFAVDVFEVIVCFSKVSELESYLNVFPQTSLSNSPHLA